MSNAACLQAALEHVEISPLIALLKEACRNEKPHISKYFLVMDLVRFLGPATVAREDLIAIQALITRLLVQAVPHALSLPEYPSLQSRVNVFHVLAIYACNDREKTEIFFSAIKQAGLARKNHLRAMCGKLGSTPLHLSAENGNAALIDLILLNDPNQIMLRNADGLTAADIVPAAHSEIASLLKKKESEFLRKQQLKGAAKEVSISHSSESSPPPEEPRNAFESMMEVLRGYNRQPAAPVFAAPPKPLANLDPEEVEFHAMRVFIKGICERVPQGELYAELYLDFFKRLGITKLSVLKAQLFNSFNASKLPPWLKHAIDLEIDSVVTTSPLHPSLFHR